MGFGFWVSWLSGSGFGIRVFLVHGFGFLTQCAESSAQIWCFYIWGSVSSFKFRASSFGFEGGGCNLIAPTSSSLSATCLPPCFRPAFAFQAEAFGNFQGLVFFSSFFSGIIIWYTWCYLLRHQGPEFAVRIAPERSCGVWSLECGVEEL